MAPGVDGPPQPSPRRAAIPSDQLAHGGASGRRDAPSRRHPCWHPPLLVSCTPPYGGAAVASTWNAWLAETPAAGSNATRQQPLATTLMLSADLYAPAARRTVTLSAWRYQATSCRRVKWRLFAQGTHLLDIPARRPALICAEQHLAPRKQMRTRTCRRSAWRVLSPLVLSALAAPLAVAAQVRGASTADAAHGADRDAAAAADPQTRPVAACAGDVRLFLELSAMGLLTVGLAVAARRGASHCRRLRSRPQQRQDIAADKATMPSPSSSPSPLSTRTAWSRSAVSTGSVDGPRLRILRVVARAVAALSIAAWAITGLVFAASTSTPADELRHEASLSLHECNGWEVAAAAVVGGSELLLALWLLGSLAADVVATSLVRPPNEVRDIFASAFASDRLEDGRRN